MHFTEPVIFEIPVLPRIQKFLSIQLAGQPLMAIPSSAPFGLILWSIAQSEKLQQIVSQRRVNGKQQREYYLAEYSGRIGIGICEFHGSRSQYLLNHTEVVIFNQIAEWHLRNSLIQALDNRMPGVSMAAAVRAFADRYDFSDEEFSESAYWEYYMLHKGGKVQTQFAPHICFSQTDTAVFGVSRLAAA